MSDQYAVIGNPIAHSKSPLIHAAFAKQTQQAMHYEALLAPLDGFAATVQALIEQGYKGVNVTVPFKFEAFQLANQHSARAIAAGAANTLSFNAQGIVADNTDGAGIVRDIEQNLGRSIAGKRVLLIGAGGAAGGVLQPLLAAKPSTLVISNRSLDKAQRMVKKEAQSQIKLQACRFEDLKQQTFDIIINATSAGLTDSPLAIPNSIFAQNCLAYDMMYGRETPFMRQAKDHGAQVADGLGMLVEQAAEAFFIWRDIRPTTQAVMQHIRTHEKLATQ
ncbi:MAG: shikimate dehydrogenase [Methylotenera sp.]|nr:shikimate dehydrogenase [Methylotenera sp.]